MLFAGLLLRLPFALAGPLSALPFALAHGLGVHAPILVLGTGLAYVYWRTGTLWTPIVTHMGVNAISLALVFVAPRV